MKSAEILCLPLREEECGQMVSLHRDAFPPDQVARSIFCSPNVERYFVSLTRISWLMTGHVLYGAWLGKTLVGYAHFRTVPDSWHLNYIAVAPTYRGHGVGQALFNQWVTLGRQQAQQNVSLDVEANNQCALDWYQRRGLKLTTASWTYEKGRVSKRFHDSDLPQRIDVRGWENAEAWQQAYGFSEFSLIYKEQVWMIGRLGEHWFRVGKLAPPALERILSAIDSDRQLLIVTPEPILQNNDLKPVGHSFRLKSVLAY